MRPADSSVLPGWLLQLYAPPHTGAILMNTTCTHGVIKIATVKVQEIYKDPTHGKYSSVISYF